MKKPLFFTHRTVDWWNRDVNQLKGADFAELDIRKTADDVLVVSHFRSVKNTIRRILVDQHSYSDLCRKSNRELPKLEKIIAELDGKVRFNLDLKQEGMVFWIKKFIRRHKIEKELIIDSGYSQDLEELAREFPKASFAYSFNYKDKRGLESFRIIKAMAYFSYFAFYPLWPKVIKLWAKRMPFIPAASMYYRVVNQGVVDYFHDRDIPVYVWPVNDERSMRNMIRLGVDGIKTSKPELLKRIVR